MQSTMGVSLSEQAMLETPPYYHSDLTDSSIYDPLTVSNMSSGSVGHSRSKKSVLIVCVGIHAKWLVDASGGL